MRRGSIHVVALYMNQVAVQNFRAPEAIPMTATSISASPRSGEHRAKNLCIVVPQ